MSLLDAAGVMTGDIWCSGAFSFESPLKDLLDSGDYTLEQLLAEDELLQELRGVHPILIEIFSTEEAVTRLIKYITLPPFGTPPTHTVGPGSGESIPASSSMVSESLSDEEEEESNKVKDGAKEIESKVSLENGRRVEQHDATNDTLPLANEHEKDAVFVRYPYMSCEVICCEIKSIIDTLVDGYVPASTIPYEDEGNTIGGADNEDKTKRDPRKSILDLLFQMLYEANAGEIDDYRAGYFDKILSVLFRKRPQALAHYINEGGGRGQMDLMKAMFKHLYSHSIMQIVQRLLLPQPPILPKDDEDDELGNQGEAIFPDPLEVGDLDGFGSFRCTWADSYEALELLLECLIDKSPYPDLEQDDEKRLSLYQNASEVLITIIQNSPLTSPTIHTLTSNPVLERLIRAASVVDEGDFFSPHDSRQTCTMNVLESLILQLGGYGSVGTMMYVEDEEDEERANDGDIDEAKNVTTSEEGGSIQCRNTRQELATSDTLISHLPFMLSNLCQLLQYPESDMWTSPMQFARQEPQKILGSSRLRIVRLLESLVLLGDPNVDSHLCESNCLEICLDLFWKFQWCSMLHQSVANLLVHVFEGANSRAELQAYFLVNCNLLGRLMDSFWEGSRKVLDADMEEENEDAENLSRSSVDARVRRIGGSDAAAETGLKVQNDEKEEQNNDSQIVCSRPGEHTPPQSFRLGYMGHVIIICQALVHACSNEAGDPSVEGTNELEMNGELDEYVTQQNRENDETEGEERGAPHQVLERRGAADSVITDETPANPLILAQLVETHPFRRRWEDFVQSTLASETAIQSTPLGGFPGTGPGMDPLHMHRPGLAEEDGFDDDDGAAPPLPPRGLLVGGDVIDMDDNDLDIAASMMVGLNMGRGAESSRRNDRDLLAGIPQQSSDRGQPGGYMFDDPLGDGRFGRFDGDDDSSDEESELSGNTGDSGGAVVEGVSGSADHLAEAPVMDLFAGNFEAFDSDKKDEPAQQGAGWSDFANFDSAFEGGGGPPLESDDPFKTDSTNGNIDEIFGGVKDHSVLFEELVNPTSDAVVTKMSSAGADSSSDEEDPVVEQEVDIDAS